MASMASDKAMLKRVFPWLNEGLSTPQGGGVTAKKGELSTGKPALILLCSKYWIYIDKKKLPAHKPFKSRWIEVLSRLDIRSTGDFRG